jgi:hypothetical protein
VFWRVDGDDAEQGRRLFLDGYTLPLHLLRQARQCNLNAIVDVDRVDIGIGAQLERADQRVTAIVTANALHVDHFVDADDLRFDRLSNRCIDHAGICARISGGDLYLGRDDIGVLREGNDKQ